MSYPSKLTNNKIISAVIEVRFETNNFDLFFADIIAFLRKTEKEITVENTNIMNLPEVVRITDQSLLLKPWKKITVSDFVILASPKILAVDISKTYNGWEKQSTFFIDLINNLKNIADFSRIGVRYIDFFSEYHNTIFSKTNLSMDHSKFQCSGSFAEDTYKVRIDFKNDVKSNLFIANDVKYKTDDGAIIDFDVYKQTKLDLKDVPALLNLLHDYSLEVFFNLINDEVRKLIGG